jgi:2,6-dihydroxypseudooxynicotine hydrolase
VILVPGLDSTKEELRATEELFLQRGLATFAIDGPGQGEAEYDLPIRPDWEVVGAAVVDALAAMPEVDDDRIGAWGVSLGGYYAPRMASGEPRIKACAALCGPFDFGAHWDGKPELTRETFRVRSRSTDMAEARKRAAELTLEGRTGTIRCPLLIISGRLDRIVPWQEQQRLHDAVSGSELLMLENGNHGCANVLAEHRYRTADWMAARLG